MTRIAGLLTFAMIAAGLLTMFSEPMDDNRDYETVMVLANS